MSGEREDFDTIGCNSTAGVGCAGNATIDKGEETTAVKDSLIERIKAKKDAFMLMAKEQRAQ